MSEPSSGPGAAVTIGVGSVSAEAGRRRTFAVISHPDAGKSTLTEALSLHARAIGQAGAVHGKAGRRSTVSDWMEMEQARGISISSSALQFTYRDIVLNLVDTPGHADFSEDTYRVLTAVDSAVMLLDAAKGLEPQTMKLFEVCRSRGVPIVTVVNKWDRPGRDPLALMDEIQTRTGLIPTPLTWPVGIAGDFRGVLDRTTGGFIKFTRTAGGASIAPQQYLDPDAALASEGAAWADAVGRARAARRRRLQPRRGRVPGRADHAGAVRRRGAELRRRAAARRAVRPRAARGPASRRRRACRARSRRRSAPRCSRSRPGWTPRTATGWRSPG